MSHTKSTLLLLLSALLFPCQELRAQNVCSTADLFGPYVLSITGTLSDLTPVPGPFARIGRALVSGDGTFAAPGVRTSYSGIIHDTPFGGTYRVSPDCTGELITVFPPGGVLSGIFPVFGALGNDGNEALIATAIPVPGAVAKGIFRKQRIRDCTTDTFRGPFRLEMSGVLASPESGLGPYLRLGRIQSLGDGTFGGAVFTTYNGVLAVENIAGAYRIGSDCMVAMTYTISGEGGSRTERMEGGLTSRDEAILMLTTPGFVVSGTLGRF